MKKLQSILTFLLVCVAFTAHANTSIEELYVKVSANPDVKTANLLIKKLYDNNQADTLFVFKRPDDPRLMFYISVYMSFYYFDNGDYKKSIEMNKQALEYAEPVKDTAVIADNLLQMSTSYIYLSEYQAAIKVNMKAITLAEKSGNFDLMSTAYHNLALSNKNLKNLNAAWRFIDKAIATEKKQDDPEGLSSCLGMAAENLADLKDYDKALTYIHEAITQSEKANNSLLSATHHIQAADIYIVQKKFEKADKESKQALSYFENNEPRLETMICYKQYGQIQISLKNYVLARRYLKKAEGLCINMNNLHQLAYIYGALAEAEKFSNPALALQYLQKRDDIKDSIFSQETNKLVSDAEVKYETAKKEQIILQQVNDLKTRRIWMIGGAAAAMVVILLIIVYVSIINSRKNKRHAAQLKVERDEATAARDEATAARDEATKARDAAERANALKGVFIDNVVHELRTPINAIQGFSQLLDPSFGSSPEETQEYLGIINDNCNNLITLVQDTIDVSEMENEDYPVHPTEFGLNGMCKEAVEKERHRVQGNVNLSIVEKEDVIVNTDRTLLSRLLANLVSNACKYTTQGSITVEFHHGLWSERQGFSREEMMARAKELEKDSGPAKPWNLADDTNEDISTAPILAVFPAEMPQSQEMHGFSITVTDTGCGIAPENAEKIFNRYEKLGSYVPGNGMGLPIVRLIAHLLKGEAYLDTSYEGKGSRFVVEISF